MNEEWTLSKQKVIETACNNICKHGSLSKDLAQEVSIWFLTNKLPDTVTDGFIYVVAYKAFHLSGSEFRRLHVDEVLKQSLDINEYKDLNIENLSVDEKYEKTLEELDDIEQCWAREIVKRNLSINLFSQHSGISRQKAKERMDFIYHKLRKANEK